MRTALDFGEQFQRLAEQKARKNGRSWGAFIEGALRIAFGAPPAGRRSLKQIL